jgi:hypothetical protein
LRSRVAGRNTTNIALAFQNGRKHLAKAIVLSTGYRANALLEGSTVFAHPDQRIEAALSTEFTMEFNDGMLALHLEIYMT